MQNIIPLQVAQPSPNANFVTQRICVFRCNGSTYNLLGISNFLTENAVPHQIYGDVLYLNVVDYNVNLHADGTHHASNGGVFVFNYGCIVLWGVDSEIESKVVADISEHLSDPLEKPFSDSCRFVLDNASGNEVSSSFIDMEQDTIIIQDEKNDVYLLLAFSYGLSQSAKLFQFEDLVANTIEENQQFPIELAKTGQISLSRQKLAQKMGALFMTRNFVINLNSNILDIPDFFWRRPQYESYYDMSIKFMDLKQRMTVLDQRLTVIYELYGILSNELQHTHSSRLEWTVIWLIFIEVILTIMTG